MEAETGDLVLCLRKGLSGHRPGYPAQLRMGPRPRPGTREVVSGETEGRQAGVLILLYPDDGSLYTVLTLRTDCLENHRGQISFPGGQNEADETLEMTALREAEEELGVSSESLEVLGQLTPLYIPPSQFCVTPTVAYIDRRPEFIPAPDEVKEVIEIPLFHLLDPKTVSEEEWTIGGNRVCVPFYAWERHKIWGATAMVLSEFIEMVRRICDGTKDTEETGKQSLTGR